MNDLNNSTLQVGVAREKISPPVGSYLIGMERKEVSTSLHDDLFATALVLKSKTSYAAIVSMDLLVIHPETVSRVRENIRTLTDIPPSAIMFSATHNHSGPASFALQDSPTPVKEYAHDLVEKLTQVIMKASQLLIPAKVGFGTGKAQIGINRRLTLPNGKTVIAGNPEGPIDDQVSVLRIDSVNNQPIAIVVNYACHPVVLGAKSNQISSDWVGVMRQFVESKTWGKVLFIQGAAGDINPLPGEPTNSETDLKVLGELIGNQVVNTWQSIQTMPQSTLLSIEEKVFVPFASVADYRNIQLEEMGGALEGLNMEEMKEWLRTYMPWSVELKENRGQQEAALQMQAVQIGDTAIIGIGAELFSTIGKNIKKHSPFENTMVAGYTNGLLGYIPTPDEYPRGGYEIDEAYLGFWLPAPLAPETAEIVEQKAVEYLQKIKSAN